MSRKGCRECDCEEDMELECEADYPENTHDTSIRHNMSERIPSGSLSRAAPCFLMGLARKYG